jgi:H+/Cl- antiporter ClcA/Tfp pilus assembly protein PilE
MGRIKQYLIQRGWLLIEFVILLAIIGTSCIAYTPYHSWKYHSTLTAPQLSLLSNQREPTQYIVPFTNVWDNRPWIKKNHDRLYRLYAKIEKLSASSVTDLTRKDNINGSKNDIDIDSSIKILEYTNSTETDSNSQLSTTESTFRLQYAAYDMICAGIVGIVTGIVVANFKLSIEAVRVFSYSLNILDYLHNEIGAIFIPVIGGMLVGVLMLLGPFSPGLRGTVKQVEDLISDPSTDDTLLMENKNHPILDRIQQQIPLLRKTTAAICTLGTGCSLGPEGPCVELGMGISRSCMDLFHRRPIQQYDGDDDDGDVMTRSTWNRVLLSCGAAAGVSAGFDAPVAGVFFALEVMQSAFTDISVERRRRLIKDGIKDTSSNPISNQQSIETNIVPTFGGLFSSSSTLFPVLLASVLSALCARSILGDHLTFNVAHTDAFSSSPLLELPIYMLLGSICGIVAFLFSQSANVSRSFFKGEIGNESIRTMMGSLPPNQKPIIGGLFCGITALFFPQILFFGYETLNSLLSNTVNVPTTVLLSLLVVKAIATAVSIGSGLVGGTLAPALFMGGVTGASFHNILSDMYQYSTSHINGVNNIPLVDTFLSLKSNFLADLPDYAMVGSASVLAALFRAPLTASLLLFELSRDYDVILPIIASAGVGSVVADILEDTFVLKPKPEEVRNNANSSESYKQRKPRRDQDSASWGDLSDKDDVDGKFHLEQYQKQSEN